MRRIFPAGPRPAAFRSTAACLAGFCALSLVPVAAHAHAFLRSASPAVGSEVTRPPSEVVIDFTEEVEPAFCAITVSDAAGHRVDTGTVHEAGGAARLAIALRPLPPGRYRVSWHATAVDTHKTEGSFVFTVQRPG